MKRKTVTVYIYLYISKDATKKTTVRNKQIEQDHAGYKTSIQKYAVFPYINNELSQREIKKIIPFTVSLKQMN